MRKCTSPGLAEIMGFKEEEQTHFSFFIIGPLKLLL